MDQREPTRRPWKLSILSWLYSSIHWCRNTTTCQTEKIVQECHKYTIVTKSKADVCELKLEKFIILPDDTVAFEEWREGLDDDEEVQVWYPHEQHGLLGKWSNQVKPDVMNDFLLFIDNNSTPNGRQSDSHCPTFYFLPTFRRIDPPKPSEKDYDGKVAGCLVSEFNHAQQSEGKVQLGHTLSDSGWNHTDWRHKVDYNCDTCKRLETELSSAPNCYMSSPIRECKCWWCSVLWAIHLRH